MDIAARLVDVITQRFYLIEDEDVTILHVIRGSRNIEALFSR